MASIQQLFIGVQAGQFAFQEGTVAMMMCQWVQACSGGNGRFVQQAAQYVFGEGSNIGANNGDWISATMLSASPTIFTSHSRIPHQVDKATGRKVRCQLKTSA